MASNGATPALIRVTLNNHGLVTNDVIQLTATVGTVESIGQWVITRHDANTFDLNLSRFANAWISGGTVKHIGHVSAAQDISNLTLNPGQDLTIRSTMSANSPACNARLLYESTAVSDFSDARGEACEQFSGSITTKNDVALSKRLYELPMLADRLFEAGSYLRAALFLSGGAGASATFTTWFE
jgi:hypothetical protein